MTESAAAAEVLPAPPPTNAAEARAVLSAKTADKGWGAKLFSGDIAVTAEYRDLRALIDRPDPADAVAAAMSSEDRPGFIQDSRAVELRGIANHLRQIGYSEQQIKENLEGKEPSQADIDIARQWKARRSQEFVKRLMSGDPEARLLNTAANDILSRSPERK